VQGNITRAQTASNAGQWDVARAAYEQAIAASPDSAFLYRDLAIAERRAGRSAEALVQVRQALTLDPNDARAHATLAALLDEQGDAAGALVEYERARTLDASEVSAADLARARENATAATLPAEYRAIATADTITRGQLAALVGVHLDRLIATVKPRQVVITDIRGNWAQDWITTVVRAGVMDTLPNYTFEPETIVRRAELAQTVSRALTLVAAQQPARAQTWQAAQLSIADLPPEHLAYPAVSAAVAAGVMQLQPDGTFQLLGPVTGANALSVIERLEALAAP
jgi:tetratricopeptide (TPR) repeat protein